MHARFSPVLALGLIALICGLLWSRTSVRPLHEYDQNFYISIAYDLKKTGQFTNGIFDESGPGEVHQQGMRLAPLYPALLALAAAVDSNFSRALDCVAQSKSTSPVCDDSAGVIRVVQLVLLIVFYWLVWWTAGKVLGTPRSAWIALAFALLTAPLLLRFVNYLMTEVTALVLLALAIAATVAARSGRIAWMFAAGTSLGLTALTRPAFLYLVYAAILVGTVAAIWRKPRLQTLSAMLAFLMGAVVVLSPWIIRNAVVLGKPALTSGYDSHTLVQRVAYNQMTWKEYGLFYLCEMPDGLGLSKFVFGAGACERFSWEPDRKNSYYQIGNGPLMTETLNAAGGWEKHLSYVVHHYILASPISHILVTVPFTLTGAWINHYWGVVLGFACFFMTIKAIRGRDVGLLCVTLPCWFMLVFHGAVAINQVRYNLILILPYSIAGAWMVERLLTRLDFPARSDDLIHDLKAPI